MPYRDPEAQKEYLRQHYQANKVVYKDSAEWRRRVIRRTSQEVKSTNPCMDCGVQYPYYVMQFDHRPGEVKSKQLADIPQFGSVKTFLTEMDKCDIVCANCHAMRSFERQFYGTEAC